LLIWDSREGAQERIVTDAQHPSQWLVDGQQRATALCILFGRKPYWWPDAESWERTMKRYDIRFDVEADNPPFFQVANAAMRRARNHRWVRLADLLVLDTVRQDDLRKIQALARLIKEEGLCGEMDAMEVFTRLDRVRKIREKDVVTITVRHDLEDVVEIFARLNSRGTRVTEADIYLGVVAARAPGWVRDEFLPFLNILRDYGFDLSPNLVFRSLTAISAGKTRFRDIPDHIWDSASIQPAWERTQRAWKNLIRRLAEYGVLSNDPLPTEAALVTLIALQDKFSDSPSFHLPFYWLLQASRFGRYSGSGTTSLDEDLRAIAESSTMRDAVVRLLTRFEHERLVNAEDFMDDYGNARFGRFLLYLLIWHNRAQDWDASGYRLGFEGTQALADFRPQWHHIFPKKFLGDRYDESEIDALANIAVIGSSINIRISARSPMDYLRRYEISEDKLAQQFIPRNLSEILIEGYQDFIRARAGMLVDEANGFLRSLHNDIE
jgi:hypothetical protein